MSSPKIPMPTDLRLQNDGEIFDTARLSYANASFVLIRDSGDWALFTGDQLGSLLASHVLEGYKSSGRPVDKLAMVASTVSSKMIQAMANVEGFKFVECLTGK